MFANMTIADRDALLAKLLARDARVIFHRADTALNIVEQAIVAKEEGRPEAALAVLHDINQLLAEIVALARR